jgi:hypothetical protein
MRHQSPLLFVGTNLQRHQSPLLFVGTDLLETPIPTIVCYVGTNLLTSLQVLHMHFLHWSSCCFCLHQIFSASLLLLSPDLLYTRYFCFSLDQLCTHYLCFFQINSTITPFVGQISRHSLLLLSPDLLDAHSFFFSLPSPDLLASSSSSSLDLPLQVFLARIPDLFARTPDLIFTNI